MAKLFVIASSSVVAIAVAIQDVAPLIANSVTLAGAIATIIAAIFIGWVNVIAARSAAKKAIAPVAEEVSHIKETLAPVAEKVKGIEAHVNSEKTRDQGVIVAKDLEIKLLREVIEKLDRSSALLAQAQATRDLGQVVAQAAIAGATTPSVAPLPAPVLQEIEQHTKATAANTAKTDVAVQALKEQA